MKNKAITKRMKEIISDMQNGAQLITSSESNMVSVWKDNNEVYEFGSFLLFRMYELGIVYQEPKHFDYVLTPKFKNCNHAR